MNSDEILKGDDTAEFLKKISTRLAGRNDCKYVEFKVKIQNNKVSMNPLVYVFPDTHHRADVDKMSVLTFINQQYQGLQKLADGTYEYQYSDTSSKKRRRWVKVK